jgi:hypothetical protein
VYIEIFLEFNGDKRMCEVQENIDRIKASIQAHIPKSTVSVVPTSTFVCINGTDSNPSQNMFCNSLLRHQSVEEPDRSSAVSFLRKCDKPKNTFAGSSVPEHQLSIFLLNHDLLFLGVCS